MDTEEIRYRLPADVVLRARHEKTLLNPLDVQYEGDLFQKLGQGIPDEWNEIYRPDGIHIYEEDGQWWAGPLSRDGA